MIRERRKGESEEKEHWGEGGGEGKGTRIKSIENEIHSCFLLIFFNNQTKLHYE
jgi:hypothetical protein